MRNPRDPGGHGGRALMTDDDCTGVEGGSIDLSRTAQAGKLAGDRQ